MGLELILLVAVAAFVARQIQIEQQRLRESPSQPVAAEPPAAPALPALTQSQRRITVAGARHYTVGAETAFLKRFGLSQRGLQDACALAGPVESLQALPGALGNALRTMLEHGHVRGTDVTAFITGARAIGTGEALYLALYESGRLDDALDLVAFVDVAR